MLHTSVNQSTVFMSDMLSSTKNMRQGEGSSAVMEFQGSLEYAGALLPYSV